LNGKLFPGRSLKGVHKDGPIFLALADLPEDPNDLPAAVVLIVRVTDYEAFRDGLLTKDEREDLVKREGYQKATIDDKPVFFLEKKGYAIVAQRRNLAEQFLKARPGLDRKLDKDTAQELLDADLSVYVDPVAIGKQYGEALAKFREAMEEKLKEDSPF